MLGFEHALLARWPDTLRRPGCRIPSGADARNPTSRHLLRSNASLDHLCAWAVPSGVRLVIFNRVPKCGSTTLETIIMKQAHQVCGRFK